MTALVQKYVQTAKGSALLAGIRKQLKLGADVIPSDGQTLGYFYKLLKETEGKL